MNKQTPQEKGFEHLKDRYNLFFKLNHILVVNVKQALDICAKEVEKQVKVKLNYKRYVEVPLDCEVQTVALFFS